MKRILAIVCVLVMLCGCSAGNIEMDRALDLRSKFVEADTCEFSVNITADYGEKLYKFKMHCSCDSSGKVTFSVTEPDSIAGITGTLDAEGGKLTFDGKALMFEMLADEQITPVSAPWLFVRALRGGYIKGCGKVNEGLYIQIDDSYKSDALQLDVWTDGSNIPVRAEVLWKGRRIVSMDVENFRIG